MGFPAECQSAMRKSAASFYSLPDLGQGHRSRVFGRLLAEAVTLAAGGDRRLVAALALLQSALPLLVYATAILLPGWVFRARRDMQAAT